MADITTTEPTKEEAERLAREVARRMLTTPKHPVGQKCKPATPKKSEHLRLGKPR